MNVHITIANTKFESYCPSWLVLFLKKNLQYDYSKESYCRFFLKYIHMGCVLQRHNELGMAIDCRIASWFIAILSDRLWPVTRIKIHKLHKQILVILNIGDSMDRDSNSVNLEFNVSNGVIHAHFVFIFECASRCAVFFSSYAVVSAKF